MASTNDNDKLSCDFCQDSVSDTDNTGIDALAKHTKCFIKLDDAMLQEEYLPTVESTKSQGWFCNKNISIIIDETTNYNGQAVFNVYFICGGQISLVRTEYLNVVNNISIAQLIVKTLNYYNISFDNVALFISDNSKYMLQAFQILSPLIPRLKNNRCLAQIVNLVGESWIYYKNFRTLTKIVSDIEASFTQCPARIRRWCDLLKSFNLNPIDPNYNQTCGNLTILSYTPIKCDLISWFKFIFWINKHLTQLRKFYIEEEMINNESEVIRELVMIFKNPVQFFIFEIFIIFLASNAKRIVEDYEFFKIKDKPIAPFVTKRLALLEAALQYGSARSPFNDELKAKFSENTVEPKLYIKIFKEFGEAFQLALNTLKKNIDNHPALPIFNAIQCFDPRYVRAHCKDIELYSEIEEFKNPEKSILEEWEIYYNLKEEFGNDELDLDCYWKNKIEMLPNLSRLALDYIWLPVSRL